MKEKEESEIESETVCHADNGKVNPTEKIVRKRKFSWTPKRKEAFKKCVEANRKRKKDQECASSPSVSSPLATLHSSSAVAPTAPTKRSRPPTSSTKHNDNDDDDLGCTTSESSSSSTEIASSSSSSSSMSSSTDPDSDSDSDNGRNENSKSRAKRHSKNKNTSRKSKKAFSRKKKAGEKKQILGTLKKMKK